MYRVDMNDEQMITEFGYENQDGDIEKVNLEMSGNPTVSLTGDNCDYDLSCIYVKDIPHMIKALQMAYDEVNKFDNNK